MDEGKKILMATYWNSKGWRNGEILPEDYELAKQQGYMFDPVEPISHEETLSRIHTVLQQISPMDVANAFLYSLSTRELAYRSALGSYYYALAIPEHTCDKAYRCTCCDWYPFGRYNDYNVFNFERHKWGGVRHDHADYALFDLEQFLRLPKVQPTEEDRRIFRSVLNLISELPPAKKAGTYQQLITSRKILKSNKGEISVMLGILGVCGILSGSDAPCYSDYFADVFERAPIEHTNDYLYPVNRWHASDGVNEARFLEVFGFPLAEL